MSNFIVDIAAPAAHKLAEEQRSLNTEIQTLTQKIRLRKFASFLAAMAVVAALFIANAVYQWAPWADVFFLAIIVVALVLSAAAGVVLAAGKFVSTVSAIGIFATIFAVPEDFPSDVAFVAAICVYAGAQIASDLARLSSRLRTLTNPPETPATSNAKPMKDTILDNF